MVKHAGEHIYISLCNLTLPLEFMFILFKMLRYIFNIYAIAVDIIDVIALLSMVTAMS